MAYDEKDKPLKMETIPGFLEAFQFDDPLPPGHEALQGYLCGSDDILDAVERIMEKYPTLEEGFQQEMQALLKDRRKFGSILENLWDDERGGYKGIGLE